MDEEKKNISIKQILLNGMSNFVVVAALMILFFIFYKFESILDGVMKLVTILLPIILGIVLAYLLGPLVTRVEIFLNYLLDKFKKRFLEEHIVLSDEEELEIVEAKELETSSENGKKRRKQKLQTQKTNMRLPAILLCIAGVIFCVYLLMYMVIPEIVNNIENLARQLPAMIYKVYLDVLKLIQNNKTLSELVQDWYSKNFNNLTSTVTSYLYRWVRNDLMDQLSVLINGMIGIMRFVVDVVVSIIVAIYVLMSKENFRRQFRKLTVAFLSDNQSKHLYTVLKECDKIFGGFISGKLIDSLIIGMICFVGALILNLPYAMLISVIVGITNVIPFFGPYIGAVPSAVLIFLVNPKQGVIFIIFILLLQQFDGNILGPRILGETVGLSPFWIIFSILLGSGLFGIVGMLIGVPVFGVISYLCKTFVNYKLMKKGKTDYIMK